MKLCARSHVPLAAHVCVPLEALDEPPIKRPRKLNLNRLTQCRKRLGPAVEANVCDEATTLHKPASVRTYHAAPVTRADGPEQTQNCGYPLLSL